MANRFDILLTQGEDRTIGFKVWTDDLRNTLKDLSSGAAKMQVRPRIEASEKLIDVTEADSTIVLADNTGPENLSLVFDDAQTGALASGQYVYDLFLDEAGTDSWYVVSHGDFTVRRAVTRDDD